MAWFDDPRSTSSHPTQSFRMTVRLRTALAALLIVAASTGGLPLARATALPAAPAAVTAAEFPPIYSDVTVARDIPYRQAITWDNQTVELAFDLYEPSGDNRSNRPIFVWIHGGSFAFGDKGDSLDAQVATEIAKRGMVAVSINYRLGPDVASGGIGGVTGNQALIEAILRAYEDAREAVRFLREHASQYRLDPDRIFIGGASAGGVTALNVGYLPDHSQGAGGPTDPYRVAGVVSIAGETLTPFAQAGEPPLFMAHGTEDTTVPYAEALAFCEAARAVGISCTFESYPAGHVSLVQYFDDILDKSSDWLRALLAQLDSQPPPPPPAPAAPVATPVAVTPAFTG